ncbi:tetratricopeptide repeat protein [candidate division WOR-3 bacterium]|nr:tetratricopeptide repeat protein [candidate division WOR-3 bacterium]
MCRVAFFVVTLFVTSLAARDLSSQIDSLKVEIEKNPGVHELHFTLANCYYGLEDYTNAVQELSRVLDLKPDSRAARFKMAMCYLRMDSIDIARAELERVRDMNPVDKHPYYWLWLGHVYGTLGFYDEMLDAFEEYKRLAGKDFHHRYGTRDYYDVEGFIAQSYALMGRTDEAIKYYRGTIGGYWGPYRHCLMLAMIYAGKGDASNAAKWLDKTLMYDERYYHYYSDERINRTSPRFLRTKATFLWRIGRFDDAVATMDSIGSYTELDTVDLYNRMVFKISAGDPHALDDLRQSGIPSSRLQVGYDVLMLLRVDSLSEAMSLLSAAEEYLSVSGFGRGLYAYILEESGYGAEAVKWWYRSYGNLPLGIDVESMRRFMHHVVAVCKEKPR